MARHSRRRAGSTRGPVLAGVLVLSVAAASIGAVRVLSGDDSTADPSVCTLPAGTLTVGAAPAVAPWLSRLAASYTAEHRVAAGRCVTVTVEPLSQDQAQQALQPVPFPGAAAPPDVWIPESTTSVALLRARKENVKVLAVPTPSVATSPVVLAAPADALRLLTRGSQPQLGDLIGLLRDPRGWGQPGLNHPEWGPIKVSTTDPGSTPLGTGLLLALTGVLTRTPTPEVDAAAFRRPEAREGLLGLTRAFGPPAANPTALLAPLQKAGTVAAAVSSTGILAAYEKDVWQYDRDSPAIVLAAAYPVDGQLAADYPYVVPNGSWVDTADRAAAADFRTWLLSAGVQSRLDGFGLRRADGVAGPAIAAGLRTDSLLPLAAVPQEAVDGPIAARTAWRLLTRRISLLGLFDVSGSMADPVPGSTRSKLDVARAAAQAALGFFDPQDSVGLWEFSRQLDGDKDYRVLVPLGPTGQKVGPYPNRQVASVAAYRAMVPRTATGLYDSILAAYKSATAAYRPDAVNTVVVITDGANEDPGSITLDQLLAQLSRLHNRAKPVHIVTLAYGTGADPASLAKVAKVTDGLQFSSPDPNSIGKVFTTAVAALTG
ncbi:MAG TPA: substrate-binding domain-containing protein [Mycobacteriales bacterium]